MKIILASLLLASSVFSGVARAQTSAFTAGNREIVAFDFSRESAGVVPKGIEPVDGSFSIVEKDGQKMLKVATPTTFLLTLPEAFPQNFTIEYDLVPRQSSDFAMEELQFEAAMNLSDPPNPNSALISWGQTNITITGGGANVNLPFPGDLRLDMAGGVVHVAVSMMGTRFKLYTNGRELMNLPDLKFPRGRILRTTVWGMNDRNNAVYLTRLRIAALDPTIDGPKSTTDVTLDNAPAPSRYTTPVPAVKLSLDTGVVDVSYLKGGFGAAAVIEDPPANGVIPKHLGPVRYEPIVIAAPPTVPLGAWLNSSLAGKGTAKNGILYGIALDGQQLEFSNALITRVALPALDAGSSAPFLLDVTISPEQTRQAPATLPSVGGQTPLSTVSNFRLSIPGLETRYVTRIEPLTADVSLADARTPSVKLSNLVITMNTDLSHPMTSWMDWYNNFVVKGNSGNDQEKTLTIDMLDSKGTGLFTIRGAGVGIVAIRVLPPAPGTTSARVQAELYVERMDIAFK